MELIHLFVREILMFTELENQFVDIEAFSDDARRPLSLCLSFGQTVGHALELAARRLRMGDAACDLDFLQIRREGDLLPLDCDATVGEVLRSGDRLIVERAAGTEREAVEVDDAFRSAAARTAGAAVSAHSATFLVDARQTIGE
jgi:hypothetical protein